MSVEALECTLQSLESSSTYSSPAHGGSAHLPPATTQPSSQAGQDAGGGGAARSSPPPRARTYPSSAFPPRQKQKGPRMVCDLGLILERTEGSGLMIVKKITRDSLAEIDGRISVNDTLLKVSMFVEVYMCARPCRFSFHVCSCA
jgi:hypothetical protein